MFMGENGRKGKMKDMGRGQEGKKIYEGLGWGSERKTGVSGRGNGAWMG